jgi:hypothetical protein
MIDIHQRGWSVALSDPKQRDNVCLSMFFTFAERMGILLKVLRISKSTCEALIKGNRVAELVGCPHVVFERVHVNDMSNAGRTQGKESAAARNKRGKSKRDDVEESAVRPAKKRRSKQTPSATSTVKKPKSGARMKADVTQDVPATPSVFDTSFAEAIRGIVFAKGLADGSTTPV